MLLSITVRLIPADRYPAFLNDPDHPFQRLSVAERIADLDEFCGQLWARICAERVAAARASAPVRRAA